MNFKFVRKGIAATVFACAVIIPVQQIIATEKPMIAGLLQNEKKGEIDSVGLVNAIAEIQKQGNTEKVLKIESTQEMQFQSMVSGKVFVKTEENIAVVREAMDDNSVCVGKVFYDSAVKIIERGEIWSKITSGNVTGYVKTENLVTGKDALLHIKGILTEAYPETDIFTLTADEVEGVLSVGETTEEEQARLAAEEAARVAQEQAKAAAAKEASRQKGQDIVAYAKQFIGNPYVYGGNSLTRGTDCSGFVKGVYKHFGVSLPRTSYAMRKVGKAVSYKDIQPGDIVCYSGHVGIYAGNGKIVNAIDEQRGINLSNATYKKIITIRRIF